MRTLITVLALLTFTSCYTPRFAYSPTAHNVPVLAEKNDSKLAVSYSTNGDMRSTDNSYDRNRSNGIDVQAAYAVTNHIAVQGSYFSRSEKTHDNTSDFGFDSSVVRYKRNLFEIGAGFFTPIDSKKRVFFQAFGGIGFGRFNFTDYGRNSSYQLYYRFHDADIFKYYLEPAISFRSSNEVFAASLSTRFSVINFKNVKTNYTFQEKKDFKLDSLNRFASVFFEPAFVNSYGFNKLPGLRIEYQVGLCLLMSRQIMDYRTFNFSVGLMFDIPKLIKGAAHKKD
jgi:hypothetical protein